MLYKHVTYSPLARQQPFILGVYTDTTAMPGSTGFNLDYTQVSEKGWETKFDLNHFMKLPC